MACRNGTSNHENDGHALTTLSVAGASAVCAVPCSVMFAVRCDIMSTAAYGVICSELRKT